LNQPAQLASQIGDVYIIRRCAFVGQVRARIISASYEPIGAKSIEGLIPDMPENEVSNGASDELFRQCLERSDQGLELLPFPLSWCLPRSSASQVKGLVQQLLDGLGAPFALRQHLEGGYQCEDACPL